MIKYNKDAETGPDIHQAMYSLLSLYMERCRMIEHDEDPGELVREDPRWSNQFNEESCNMIFLNIDNMINGLLDHFENEKRKNNGFVLRLVGGGVP